MANATWRIEGFTGFDELVLRSESVPTTLGDHDCLVKIEAGTYPFPMEPGKVPGSDGAGTVIAVGSRVHRFQKGDRVCTTLNQGHIYGPLTPAALNTGLGGSLDGTFREHGVFEESGLVLIPPSLSFREASTLPCAGVTAWNCLQGLQGRALKAGDTVLTLGTGGVSVFAIQFAVAAGATVISTTSSAAKSKKLKELGAHHVINYREDLKWGETAKSLTPGGAGVDFVVEVGGASTLEQSLAAVKMDGIITVAGAVGGGIDEERQPGILEAWYHNCLVRGIAVGSRALFEDMTRAIAANKIKPVIDEKVFRLEDLKDAYQYMWDQQHFGKVVVDC